MAYTAQANASGKTYTYHNVKVTYNEKITIPKGTHLNSATTGSSGTNITAAWSVQVKAFYVDTSAGTIPAYPVQVSKVGGGGSGFISWDVYRKARDSTAPTLTWRVKVDASYIYVYAHASDTGLGVDYVAISIWNQNVGNYSTGHHLQHLTKSSGTATIVSSSYSYTHYYRFSRTDSKLGSGSHAGGFNLDLRVYDYAGNVRNYFCDGSATALPSGCTWYHNATFWWTVSYANGAISGWTMPSAGSAQTKYLNTNITLHAALGNATRSFTDTANLDANGGSSTGDSDNKLTGTRSLKRTFSKWGSYAASATYTANAAATLTASWSAAALNSASTVTLPTPATRVGYAFNGWYTASSGGNKVGNAGASVTLSNSTAESAQIVTWHANWVKASAPIYIKINGVYKEGTPYIKVNGVYQEGSAYIKQNGTWVQ